MHTAQCGERSTKFRGYVEKWEVALVSKKPSALYFPLCFVDAADATSFSGSEQLRNGEWNRILVLIFANLTRFQGYFRESISRKVKASLWRSFSHHFLRLWAPLKLSNPDVCLPLVFSSLSRSTLRSGALPWSRTAPPPARSPPSSTSSTRTGWEREKEINMN